MLGSSSLLSRSAGQRTRVREVRGAEQPPVLAAGAASSTRLPPSGFLGQDRPGCKMHHADKKWRSLFPELNNDAKIAIVDI